MSPQIDGPTAGTTSLIDRAGLDRDQMRKEVTRGLAGADDGELFLEYRQSEGLMFDNGRLKQATYIRRRASACARSRTTQSATPIPPTSRSRRWRAPPTPCSPSAAAIAA